MCGRVPKRRYSQQQNQAWACDLRPPSFRGRARPGAARQSAGRAAVSPGAVKGYTHLFSRWNESLCCHTTCGHSQDNGRAHRPQKWPWASLPPTSLHAPLPQSPAAAHLPSGTFVCIPRTVYEWTQLVYTFYWVWLLLSVLIVLRYLHVASCINSSLFLFPPSSK